MLKLSQEKFILSKKAKGKLPAVAEMAIGRSSVSTLGSKVVRCSGQGSGSLLGVLSTRP